MREDTLYEISQMQERQDRWSEEQTKAWDHMSASQVMGLQATARHPYSFPKMLVLMYNSFHCSSYDVSLRITQDLRCLHRKFQCP